MGETAVRSPLTQEEFKAVPIYSDWETVTDDAGHTHQIRRLARFHIRRDDGILFYHDEDGTWSVYEDEGRLYRQRAAL